MDQPDGSRLSVGIVYLLTIASMASIGTIIPLMHDLADALDTDPDALGLALSLFSVPSAILAGIGGGAIDAIGARRSLILSGIVVVLADAVAWRTPPVWALDSAMVLAGIGFTGITVAAPALIIETTSGAARDRAMSLWSTYPATGMSLGLLLAAPFADTPDWRLALVAHGGLMGALVLAGTLWLARPPAQGLGAAPHVAGTIGSAIGGLIWAARDAAVIRLALAAALTSAMAYGTSLVVPGFFAAAHQVSFSRSASLFAVINLAMIPGGMLAGYALARGARPIVLYGLMAAIGVAAQIFVFRDAAGLTGASAALAVWTLAIGGAMAVTMALLPAVIRNPAHTAAASGLLGQAISIASFLAPWFYFGVPPTALAGVAAAGCAIALIALPAWSRRGMRAVSAES